MAEFQNDNEVVEFAISRELDAYNFYLSLAKFSKDPKISQILEQLAEEELEHKNKLEMELIKNGIVVDQTEKDYILANSDYVISNVPVVDIEYKDLLELCIQKEDASFRFYAQLLQHAKNQDTKEALLAIIEEEIKHKHRFEIEYDLLLKNPKL